MPLSDTSPEMEAMQVRIWQSMPGEQRFNIALEMCDLTREFAKTRIRQAHPDWSTTQVIHELIRLAFLPGEPPIRFQ